MKKFSDFAREQSLSLQGDKIKIDKMLDKTIIVTGFKIADSKYDDKLCLNLEFTLDGEQHVLFTSGKVLIDQLNKYGDEIPFETKISKPGKAYIFV